MRTQAKNKREAYIEETFGGESGLLKEVRLKLREDKKEGINVNANEARILQTLIQLSGAKKVVEVGCLYGYSALWMAEALPEDGKLYTLELSKENADIAQEFFTVSPWPEKIQLIQGDATESLDSLTKDGPFDMVFIDANKGGYMKYLNWAIENLKQGGLIVGDNTFLFGHVYGEGEEHSNVGPNPIKTMQDFNTTLANQENYFSAILPTQEGMTIAIKK